MLVSISEGFCLEGLLAAILFKAGDDILAAPSGDGRLLSRCVVGVDVVGCRGWEILILLEEKNCGRAQARGARHKQE